MFDAGASTSRRVEPRDTHPAPEVVTAASGAPTLRLGAEFLDDPVDPMTAAERFADTLPDDAVDVVLFGAGLGYRVRWLVARGRAPFVLEPSHAIRALAEAREPRIFEGARVYERIPTLVTDLVASSKPGDKMVLLASPAYTRAFPEAYAALRAAIAEADGLRTVRRNTALARYPLQIEGTLRSLPRLAGTPLAGQLGRPLAGRAAFVVAAGPSLDRNAHLLGALRRKGALLAVTTAAPVLMRRGLRYDALVTIETLDQSDMLAEPSRWADVLVADMVAHPAILDLPADRRVLFLADHPAFVGLSRALREAGVAYGASVPTAAATLAYRWGADPIVLLGQDLAYTGGRAYATGTGRESFRTAFDGRVLTVEHDAAYEAAFRRGGLKPPSVHKPGVVVPAWGGEGDVVTSHDLLLSARWFESFAVAVDGRVRLVNATEGGMHLEGFEEASLESVLADLPDVETHLAAAVDAAPRLDAARVEAVRAEVAAGARAIERAARACLEARTDARRARAEATLRRLSKESPLVDTYAAPSLTPICEDPALADRPEARARAIYRAIEGAARGIARLAAGR